MLNEKRVGLSLSGGGYRAAAFHLGTLKKLEEMNVLEKVDVISTISGGSITGACYCLQTENFDEFYNNLYDGLANKDVIKKVLLSKSFVQLILFVLLFLIPAFYSLFTPYAYLFPILFGIMLFLLYKFQFFIFPVSKQISKIYDSFFYSNKTLKDFPTHPKIIIGATNLQTSRPFTFSKTEMGDSSYTYLQTPILFKSENFPISTAVMASSCVPFAFTPIPITKQFFKDVSDAKIVHPIPVDGGVYDNQGIHKIMQENEHCEYIITSDAGAGSSGEMKFSNTVSLLIATVDTFMSRIKKSSMIQYIYQNTHNYNKQIAYLSLGWDTEKCIDGFVKNLSNKTISQDVLLAHNLKPEWIAQPLKYKDSLIEHLRMNVGYDNIYIPSNEEKMIARTVGTNLKALSETKLNALIAVAKSLTEIQVKLYCPHLIQFNNNA
jgi:NTE family protein